jgi:hypothetical protein
LATIPQEEVTIFDGKTIAVAADFVRKEWEDRKVITLEDIGLGKELIRAQEEKGWKEVEAKAMGRTIPSAPFLALPRWKDGPRPSPRHVSLPSRGQKRPPPATDSVPATSWKRPRLAAPSTNNVPSDLPFTNHLIIHPSLLTTTRATHSRKTGVMFRNNSSQPTSNVLAARSLMDSMNFFNGAGLLVMMVTAGFGKPAIFRK